RPSRATPRRGRGRRSPREHRAGRARNAYRRSALHPLEGRGISVGGLEEPRREHGCECDQAGLDERGRERLDVALGCGCWTQRGRGHRRRGGRLLLGGPEGRLGNSKVVLGDQVLERVRIRHRRRRDRGLELRQRLGLGLRLEPRLGLKLEGVGINPRLEDRLDLLERLTPIWHWFWHWG